MPHLLQTSVYSLWLSAGSASSLIFCMVRNCVNNQTSTSVDRLAAGCTVATLQTESVLMEHNSVNW